MFGFCRECKSSHDQLLVTQSCLALLSQGPSSLAGGQPGPRPKAQAWPGPGQISEILSSGNPENWGPRNGKNQNSQNSNPFCPKYWQGLDFFEQKSSWPPLGPSEASFSMDRKNQKNRKNVYFPWWANGPYSPGLGPCCYPPEVGK